ncbi:MAG: hypothetical protein WCH34_18175 [Bacteroidota bacterium]
MLKKTCFSLIFSSFIFLFSTHSYAQNDNIYANQPFYKRLFIGGNVGLQFGTITLIDVSPSLGCWITNRFAVGLGVNYQYYNDKRWSPAFSTSIYGGSVFGRFYVLENLFAHVEFQLLNYETQLIDPYGILNKTGRIFEPYYLAGAGYKQAIGEKFSMNIIALYNFNESPYTLYQNPIIRIGFNIGL